MSSHRPVHPPYPEHPASPLAPADEARLAATAQIGAELPERRTARRGAAERSSGPRSGDGRP
ncbi:hypothetical protein ACIQU6_23715 [Streptomyces sp. NPDC090442]|uniref:hypothetical protein n=1 Tax=Streptomyces sp. NPDC090442 TaxID=3365962 RepID=UPI0038199027